MMYSSSKIALFDFCETLVDFQTADEYVHFSRKKLNSFSMKIKNIIHRIFLRFRIIKIITQVFPESSFNKRMILWQLAGINKKDLNYTAKAYYEEIIKKHFIIKILKKMQSLQMQGYDIILVSGGYDIYLRYFAEEYGIKKVISTKIAFSGNKCKGTIDGKDCLKYEKVKILDSIYPQKEFADILAFSDSITDLPLLKWANTGFAVVTNDDVIWPQKYGLKKINWKK